MYFVQKFLYVLIAMILSMVASDSFSQTKKYFNANDEPVTNLDSAIYFEIIYKDSLDANKKLVEVYSMSGKLKSIVEMLQDKIDGKVQRYDSLGNLIFEGAFIQGLKNGFHYKFWPNGKLRRKELFVDDTLSFGKCYDEKDKEVPYYPANREMKFRKPYKDWNDYLVHNIKYPKTDIRNVTEGKVIVSFVITEKSSIENIEIIKSVSKSIDEEAKRLVRNIPIESPYFDDDKPVRFLYFLPITFIIE